MTRPARRRTSALAGEHPAYPSPAPSETPTAPVTRGRESARVTEVDEAARVAQAKARTTARNGAYGWAAAHRRERERAAEWSAAMRQARELGADPETLREYVAEAARRAGVDLAEVSADVWAAAGLTADTHQPS